MGVFIILFFLLFSRIITFEERSGVRSNPSTAGDGLFCSSRSLGRQLFFADFRVTPVPAVLTPLHTIVARRTDNKIAIFTYPCNNDKNIIIIMRARRPGTPRESVVLQFVRAPVYFARAHFLKSPCTHSVPVRGRPTAL